MGSSATQADHCQAACRADTHAALQTCPQSAGFMRILKQAMLLVADMAGGSTHSRSVQL